MTKKLIRSFTGLYKFLYKGQITLQQLREKNTLMAFSCQRVHVFGSDNHPLDLMANEWGDTVMSEWIVWWNRYQMHIPGFTELSTLVEQFQEIVREAESQGRVVWGPFPYDEKVVAAFGSAVVERDYGFWELNLTERVLSHPTNFIIYR